MWLRVFSVLSHYSTVVYKATSRIREVFPSSKTDRIKPLEEKIQQFLKLGTEVGMLIDPDKQTVTIYYRNGRQPMVLGNGDIIALPELLPGWEVLVSELWPPVFE